MVIKFQWCHNYSVVKTLLIYQYMMHGVKCTWKCFTPFWQSTVGPPALYIHGLKTLVKNIGKKKNKKTPETSKRQNLNLPAPAIIYIYIVFTLIRYYK